MSKAIAAGRIRVKRAYEPPSPDDGTRVLVDRLWPRGVKKDSARIDVWAKDVAPSTELRKWFHHDAAPDHDGARWHEFRRRYADELRHQETHLDALRDMARHGPMTLVYATRDEAHNGAVVLRDMLLGRH